MPKYIDVLGEYDAETQAYSAFAGGAGSSPYRPKAAGRLKGIRVIVSGQAATTLLRGLVIKLTCPVWKPVNSISIAVAGHGLDTAPMANPPVYDFPIDQEVNTGNDITLEGKCLEATAVTVSAIVLGMFD